MEIAVTLMLALALLATGLTAGLVLADRRHRKQALRDLEAGEQRVRVLVEAINGTHNKLVGQVASFEQGLQDVRGTVAHLKMTANVGRPGPQHGRTAAPKA